MSRIIRGKILVTGALTAQTPISVGGAGAGDAVDLEIAMNGRGRFYVPGASLMGPMRHWLETHVAQGPALARAMFGFQEKDEGHASYLFVEDAELPDDPEREIRDGIQIDRKSGATRPGKKFTRAVLPRGTTIPLNMELDLTEKGEEFKKVLKALLQQWIKGGIRLGAAKTRGLGRVKLNEPCAIRVFDFSDKEDFFQWLENGEGQKSIPLEDLSGDLKEDDNTLTFTLTWKPTSAVMVKAGRDGLLADMIPLTSGYEAGKTAPVLPGSSIKGALRSQAAKILRTIHPQKDALRTDEHDPDPDNDLDGTILTDLFGGANCRGRVHVDDVYQNENLMEADKWVVEDKPTMDQATVHEDHVAIDRFTGGASNQALFSAAVPRKEKNWDKIALTVDFGRPVESPAYQSWKADPTLPEPPDEKKYLPLSEECRQAELALLLLLLRDLEDGFLPIGFASRRGMGDIELTGMTIEGPMFPETICWDKGNGGPGWLAQVLEKMPDIEASWKKSQTLAFITQSVEIAAQDKEA